MSACIYTSTDRKDQHIQMYTYICVNVGEQQINIQQYMTTKKYLCIYRIKDEYVYMRIHV